MRPANRGQRCEGLIVNLCTPPSTGFPVFSTTLVPPGQSSRVWSCVGAHAPQHTTAQHQGTRTCRHFTHFIQMIWPLGCTAQQEANTLTDQNTRSSVLCKAPYQFQTSHLGQTRDGHGPATVPGSPVLCTKISSARCSPGIIDDSNLSSFPDPYTAGIQPLEILRVPVFLSSKSPLFSPPMFSSHPAHWPPRSCPNPTPHILHPSLRRSA